MDGHTIYFQEKPKEYKAKRITGAERHPKFESVSECVLVTLEGGKQKYDITELVHASNFAVSFVKEGDYLVYSEDAFCWQFVKKEKFEKSFIEAYTLVEEKDDG